MRLRPKLMKPQRGETPANWQAGFPAKAQAVAIQYSRFTRHRLGSGAQNSMGPHSENRVRARAIEQLLRHEWARSSSIPVWRFWMHETVSFQVLTIPTTVEFRALTPEWIEQYVERRACVRLRGSAKAEGLGISLMQRIQSDDPTALIGLPLIALTHMLAQRGVHVLGAQS